MNRDHSISALGLPEGETDLGFEGALYALLGFVGENVSVGIGAEGDCVAVMGGTLLAATERDDLGDGSLVFEVGKRISKQVQGSGFIISPVSLTEATWSSLLPETLCLSFGPLTITLQRVSGGACDDAF